MPADERLDPGQADPARRATACRLLTRSRRFNEYFRRCRGWAPMPVAVTARDDTMAHLGSDGDEHGASRLAAGEPRGRGACITGSAAPRDELVRLYLSRPPALGGFHPPSSDLDVLAATPAASGARMAAPASRAAATVTESDSYGRPARAGGLAWDMPSSGCGCSGCTTPKVR